MNVSGDNYLSCMIRSDNPYGYNIWKDASSPVGVPLDALAAFSTSEIRMRNIDRFIVANFPANALRERQDQKARYEVSSKNTRISDIFACIEENKESLHLSDYGVSQTSLEQVFNMHAAEAEKLKQGRDDH
jgi:ATP-binding cassette subfamily A (ABC1) protein 3